jgi:hypothetical protein
MGFLRASMILIGVTFLFACNQKTSNDHPNTLSPQQVRLQEILKVGQDVQKQGCPPNSKKSTKYVKNIHNPAIMDAFVSVHCDGKTVTEYHADTTKLAKSFPNSVQLYASGTRIAAGISIGDSRESVLNALGTPTIEDGKGIHYFIMDQKDPGPDYTIAFKILDGKVEAVVWVWPVY